MEEATRGGGDVDLLADRGDLEPVEGLDRASDWQWAERKVVKS